jgi:hypothetical protein
LKSEIVSNFWETVKPFRTILKASGKKKELYGLLNKYNVDGIIEFNDNYSIILDAIIGQIISLCKGCEPFIKFDQRIKYPNAVYLYTEKGYSFDIFSKGFIFDRDEPLTYENSFFRLGLDLESEDN